MALMVRSSAFSAGGRIPARFTADGANVSPPLEWTGTPPGTAGIAVVCDDPDAPGGTWMHWSCYGLPARATSLPEGVPTTGPLPTGGRQGRNGFGQSGYGGPAPPPGAPHHYRFRVHAVDTKCPLSDGADGPSVEAWLADHTLASGTLVGVYGR